MLIKTNFHFHMGDDPKDSIGYTAYKAIDRAHALGFEAMAFTCHTKHTHIQEYENYAQEKNILLLSGIEAAIESKHVIILNCDKNSENIKTFGELESYRAKNPQIFVIAPHPFIPYIPSVSLMEKLEKNIGLFDAIEQTFFSNKIFNFNKKAEVTAKKYGKPFIATSDTHELKYLNESYAIIKAEAKTPEAIFAAIKHRAFENKTNPMGALTMPFYLASAIIRKLKKRKASQRPLPNL